MKRDIKVVAFDADDTLWENELYYQEFEAKFCQLLSSYMPRAEVSKELFDTEMRNIPLYGYGLKSIMLSMIETAARITQCQESLCHAAEIIRMGQEVLQKPIELLEGVKEVLTQLHGKYRLVLITKGELHDQERKITGSGVKEYFEHIEIVSNKKCEDYQKLLERLNCLPHEFLMLGNSVKSDILPVLEIGGYAAHIAHHATWAHEVQEGAIAHRHFIEIDKMRDILKFL